MIRIVKNDFTSGGEYSELHTCYGFAVYHEDGASLPKGAISSFNAIAVLRNGLTRSVTVEFGIQSPTGDSSDHHNYSFPCLTMEQAKEIVDRAFWAEEQRYGLELYR